MEELKQKIKDTTDKINQTYNKLDELKNNVVILKCNYKHNKTMSPIIEKIIKYYYDSCGGITGGSVDFGLHITRRYDGG